MLHIVMWLICKEFKMTKVNFYDDVEDSLLKFLTLALLYCKALEKERIVTNNYTRWCVCVCVFTCLCVVSMFACFVD